jgi:hypothetical protein
VRRNSWVTKPATQPAPTTIAATSALQSSPSVAPARFTSTINIPASAPTGISASIARQMTKPTGRPATST